MKKIVFVFVTILVPALCLATGSVSRSQVSLAKALVSNFTQPPGTPGAGPGPLPDNPCDKVNLTDAQKSSLKDLVYQSEQKHAQTEADVKKAVLNLGHTFTSSASVKADGSAAQANVASAISEDVQVQADLDLTVNYDVLQPDQREAAFVCMMFMRSHHPGPQGPGPGDQPHP